MCSNVDLKALAAESVWSDRYRYSDAERDFHSINNKQCRHSSGVKQSVTTRDEQKGKNSSQLQLNTTQYIVSDLVRARKLINKTLDSGNADNLTANPLVDRLKQLEVENQTLKKTVNDLTSLISKLEIRVSSLEGSTKQDNKSTAKPMANQVNKPVAKPPVDSKDDDNDDDVDLFGSDDDEEADEVRKKRLEEYAAKKSKKPGVVAKSSVVLDVKPWDDETDMKEMEVRVRQIEMDGLFWGASKLVPLAYGIQKLQIVTVIEDDKVSVEELTEKLEEIEDYVQSVDIAAFNKI